MTDGEGMQEPDVVEPVAESLVTAHSTAPGRTVLTERGNADAWIASDLTLETDR